MDSLEDGGVLRSTSVSYEKFQVSEKETYTANVAGRRQAQAADETGTHVRQDVTVQVRHDHHAIRVWPRVLHDLCQLLACENTASEMEGGVPAGRHDRGGPRRN